MVKRVCVLSTTRELAESLLDILCQANEDIYRRRPYVGIMSDGTELIACSIQDGTDFAGEHFDYVFYDRNHIMYSCTYYGDALEYIQQRCLAYSIIPNEFQWCAVDI